MIMKKLILVAVIGLSSLAISAQAQFFGLSVGGPGAGFSVGIGGPVYAAPAVVPAPAVAYAPPVAYADPPVAYGAPCYGYGPGVVIGGCYRGGWYGHYPYYRGCGGYYGRGWGGYHGGYWHR
jgi:hypothetical protein